MNPSVSLIIPAYNVGKYIAACLDSLYAQTHQNFEIIVAYDEKSTDNTLEVLQSYAAEKDNLIIDIGIDKGSGDARNRGFRLAKGDFILFVDGDDEVTTDIMDIVETADINIYQSGDNQIRVVTNNVNLQQVYVIDMVGRTIQYNVSGSSTEFRLPNTTGVYIIRVVGDKLTRTEKVIVK
jgi:glycosyltransferase involved in cell wall biosynthesis